MRINILTLFPEWFASPLDTALLGKAREAGLVEFDILNPRDRSEDRHHIVDDRPYGGGPGMVMMLEPLVKTLRELETERGGAGRIIMLAAAGKPLTQSLARELAREETLTLVCGRYEGIDARLMDILPVEQVSVGEAVTVRKVTDGVGVERIFPLHSPFIDHIELVTEGSVRRSRLYYLRDLKGKAARIKPKKRY